MATWKDHLDNMTAETVESANKALDYLDKVQIKWLEELLDDECRGIKDWRKLGVKPIVSEITATIIERSALSYNNEPTRQVVLGDGEVDEDETEKYLDILDRGDFHSVMDAADSVCRLLKNVIILAQSVEVVGEPEKILFSVLHRANCDVDYDNKTRMFNSLMYQSAGYGMRGGKLYHYWTSEFVQDIEIVDGQQYAGTPEPHGYGMIPAAVLWDEYRPRYGFWPKRSWEGLIQANEALNLFHTDVLYNSGYQTFPTLFTNTKIPQGQTIGPKSVVEIEATPGENVFLEYRSPDINLEKFMDWRDIYLKEIGETWGVNLKVAGSGSADSGFKLVVEEFWNLETRNKRIKNAASFERDMFSVIKAISEARGYGISKDSEFVVNFPEPHLPVNDKERWDIKKEKIATRYSSREEEWKKDDPDITPEQIAQKKAMIDAGTAVPTFGDLTVGE